MGIYHAGSLPPGTDPLPVKYPLTFTPTLPDMTYKSGDRVQGLLISEFGSPTKAGVKLTHLMLVNLDYKAEMDLTLSAPRSIEIFDASSGKWTRMRGKPAPLHFGKGCGKLLRMR